MATYTATVTLDQRNATKGLTGPWLVLSGTCTLNPYSQTLIAITAITGQFKPSGILRVVCDGVDSTGTFLLEWNAAASAFKAFSALGTQASEGNTTIGVFNWHAIGQAG